MPGARNAERWSLDAGQESRKQLANDALDIVVLAAALLLTMALVCALTDAQEAATPTAPTSGLRPRPWPRPSWPGREARGAPPGRGRARAPASRGRGAPALPVQGSCASNRILNEAREAPGSGPCGSRAAAPPTASGPLAPPSL